MGFSGGGSNVLKPHKHSSAVQDGSPLDMNNVTEATFNAGSITYSNGTALQELTKPAVPSGEVLKFESGATAPSWGHITTSVTWEQLTDDYSSNIYGNDWYSIAMLLDSNAASITGSTACTDVQFGFYTNASTTGTIYCCRWADLATYAAETSAADLYAAADHVYWSTPVNGNAAGMSAHAVTESDGLVADCLIGYVIVDAVGAEGATGAFYENFTTGYVTKRSSAGASGTYSSTPEFTITASMPL